MTEATHTRRALLSAGATALLLPSIAPAGSRSDRRIRIAVKFHMVQEPLSVVDRFQLLKDLGFDGVEVSVRDKGLVPEFIKAIETTGLPVHGVVNSSNPDIASAIGMATDVSADSVLIVAEQNPHQYYDQNFGHWQNLIRRALQTAHQQNVQLLIENVRATFLKTAEEMARFIDSFDSSAVGAYYDTGNTITWTRQSAEHWAHVLAQRIQKIDIKDRGHADFGDAKLRSATAQGTDGGEVHWTNVRHELTVNNFQGWATAEVKGGDRKRLQDIATWMNSVLNNPTPKIQRDPF